MPTHNTKIQNIIDLAEKTQNSARALFNQNYLKHPNDKFLGSKVGDLRIIARQFSPDLNLDQIKELLQNNYHEIRQLGLFCLTYQFEKARKHDYKHLMELIFDFYLDNLEYVNNWDLVDCSAKIIVGGQLLITQEYGILKELSDSDNLWARRVGIVSTLALIKNNIFEPTLELAQKSLTDKEPLMHKASGWMLREVGIQNLEILDEFLDKYKDKMPRVMLRYAIEKHPVDIRAKYLSKELA